MGLAGTLLLGSVVGAVWSGMSWQLVLDSYLLTNVVLGLGLTVPGLVIALDRDGNAVGWLFIVGGLGHLLTAAATPGFYRGITQGWPDWLLGSMSTLVLAPWQLGVAGLFLLALLLFPDGHYPSKAWRPVGWAVIAMTAAQIITGVLSEGNVFGAEGRSSILSIGFERFTVVMAALGIFSGVLVLVVLSSLVVRYVRGGEMERRQLLWLILAIGAVILINSQRWLTGDGPIALLLSFVLVPAAIAIAIVRHELIDIRLVVSRTLVYVIVSIGIVAGYAGLVAGLSLLVPAEAGRAITIGAALAVALGVRPLFDLVQRVVQRGFYGWRSDPAEAFAHLRPAFEEPHDVATALEGIRRALRYPALALERQDSTVIRVGDPDESTPHARFPLTFAAGEQATLSVTLRHGETHLHRSDATALNLIAIPLGVALHSADLAAELLRSRASIVSAREEERSRLHRDLHDGLGPGLTAAAFRADAAHNVLRGDPTEADRLLSEVRRNIRGALDDVRRIVYGLRPLELEESGLIEAVELLSGDVYRGNLPMMRVRTELPSSMPELSPAVEVATYRIIVEAVTNAVRHSTGSECVVQLRTGDTIDIEVRDDGESPVRWTEGVGIRSVRERATELGGEARTRGGPGGGRVEASIPLGLR